MFTPGISTSPQPLRFYNAILLNSKPARLFQSRARRDSPCVPDIRWIIYVVKLTKYRIKNLPSRNIFAIYGHRVCSHLAPLSTEGDKLRSQPKKNSAQRRLAYRFIYFEILSIQYGINSRVESAITVRSAPGSEVFGNPPTTTTTT